MNHLSQDAPIPMVLKDCPWPLHHASCLPIHCPSYFVPVVAAPIPSSIVIPHPSALEVLPQMSTFAISIVSAGAMLDCIHSLHHRLHPLYQQPNPTQSVCTIPPIVATMSSSTTVDTPPFPSIGIPLCFHQIKYELNWYSFLNDYIL